MKEKIINIIKKFDYIGKTFNFRYKSHENYRSLTGGVFYICFLILTLIYSILNLDYLLTRINKSIINYDTIISPTDKMNFLNYSFSIGFSITCNKYDETINTPLNDLFKMTFKYVYRGKNENSIKKNIGLHLCNYSDFTSTLIKKSEVEKFVESGQYYCPDNLNDTISGIYEDDIFAYYEFTLSAKKTDNFTIYYNLLSNYDCKSHFLTSQIALDLNNYSYPIMNFLTDIFSQINPLSYNKRNVFLKIAEFQSSKNLYILDYNTKYYMHYSRYEDYSLYKPKERFDDQVFDYPNFVTLYFRADNERKSISRKYKTLPEYSSEVFTTLSVIYIALFLFISIVNSFYANHSIMQEFFQFKKIEKNNKNEVFTKLKIRLSENRIQRLSRMSKIAEFGSFGPGELETQSLFVKIKHRKKSLTDANLHQFSNFLSSANDNNNNENNKNNNNNNDNNININNINNGSNNNCNLIRVTTTEKNNIITSDENHNNSNNKMINPNYIRSKYYSPSNSSFNSVEKLNKLSLFNNAEKDKSPLSNQDILKIYSYQNKIVKSGSNFFSKKHRKNQEKIDLNYSIIEIIISMCCPYFSTKKLETKNKLLEKAKSKLFNGLDILTYLRNLQRTEYLNYLLLEPYQNILIGYMTKPSISLDYQFDIFEHLKSKYNPNFNYGNVEDFLRSYNLLSQIKNKTNVDTRLYNIVNIELENLCIE